MDGSRTHLNIDYCNERIQTVYHQLFDEALKRYNEKQTRSDRRIPNYYEKIRSGNQEKPFHEIILQIGNKEDMSATGKYADLARTVLDEYYQGFQERNPNLRVFSAHLHRPTGGGTILSAGKADGRDGRCHRGAESRRSDGVGRQDE